MLKLRAEIKLDVKRAGLGEFPFTLSFLCSYVVKQTTKWTISKIPDHRDLGDVFVDEPSFRQVELLNLNSITSCQTQDVSDEDRWFYINHCKYCGMSC